jgi:hypothetical protein
MKTVYFKFIKMSNLRGLLLLGILAFPSFINATSYTWIGGVSTDWGNASNWSPSSGTPDLGDDVTIQTGTFNPSLVEISGLNNFTINSGSLNLSGFTLLVSGSANFVGGSINNGALSCSGTVIFSGTTFNANVSTNSASVSFNGS